MKKETLAELSLAAALDSILRVISFHPEGEQLFCFLI